MNDDDKIQDPLKPLEEICFPDERQQNFLTTLEDNHGALSTIILNDVVPLDVRQLFETAKNLSLYSWFVYRFHQVAELIGYSALEMALKERFKQETPNKKPPMLAGLLKHAQKHQWVKNEDFPDLEIISHYNARQKKIYQIIQSGVLKEREEISVEEPTKEELQQAFDSIDRFSEIVNSAAALRNNLAHGSNTLHPNSISTLRTTAHVINALFKESC